MHTAHFAIFTPFFRTEKKKHNKRAHCKSRGFLSLFFFDRGPLLWQTSAIFLCGRRMCQIVARITNNNNNVASWSRSCERETSQKSHCKSSKRASRRQLGNLFALLMSAVGAYKTEEQGNGWKNVARQLTRNISPAKFPNGNSKKGAPQKCCGKEKYWSKSSFRIFPLCSVFHDLFRFFHLPKSS